MDCMCRVCETIYGLKNMFDEENEELLLMLRSVANISIYPTDLLPKYICELCSQRLQKTYDFKVQCETTDQKLREMLEYLTKSQIVASVEKAVSEEPVNESKHQIKHEIEIVTTKQQPTTQKTDTILIMDSEDEETMKNFDDMMSDENDEFSEEDEKEKIFEEEMKKLFEDASIIRKKKSAIIDTKLEITKVEKNVSEPKDDAPMPYEEIFINGENLDDLIIEDYSEDIGANDSAERVQVLENNSEIKNQMITKEERVVEPVNDSTKEVLSSLENVPRKTITPIQIIKEPKVYKCAVCSEIFPNNTKLAQHKRKHNKNKCNICHKIFARNSGLTSHMMIHAGKKVTCDLCGAQLSNRGNLLRHIQQCHQFKKPYPCDICGIPFSRRSSMKIHRSTHTDIRAFTCNKCGKSFKTKLYLTIHEQRHIPVEQRTLKRYPNKKKESRIYICPHCGKKSKALPTHLTHMIRHSEVKPFECQECPKKFHFKQTLITHMLVHTGEKPYKCEICGKAFRQQPHLKTHHHAVHLGARPFQCKYCKKCFSTKPTLRIHERLHTGERPFKCEECGQGFIEGKGLKKHKVLKKCKGPASNPSTRPNQEPVEYDADESKQTFKEDMSDEVQPGETQEQLQYLENALGAELEIYLQDIHNDYAEIIEVESTSDINPIKSNTPNPIINQPRVYKCAVCSEVFTEALKLASHKKKHIKTRFRCNICNKTFARKCGLKDHLLIHAGKKVPCNICGTTLSNRGNLLRHIQQCHNSVKPYKCDLCEMHFARRGNMKLHMITHSEDRPFGCDKCGKSFKTKLSLTIHHQRHIPIEQRTMRSLQKKTELFICPQCGKKSKTLPTHLTHMKIHNEVKPYECQECPKKFHFKQTLITHMLVHTGERPYKCEICGKAFRQQPHLKTHHRAVHLGARPYQCKYCKKCFTSAGTLKIHERLHTGERPFKCEECGQCFIEQKGLKKHKLFNKCKGPTNNAIIKNEQEFVEENADDSSQAFTEDMADESYGNEVKSEETQEQLQYFENTLGAELEVYLQDIHNDYAEIIEVES